MQNKLILTLDQGTTSRAIVFNHDGETVSISQNHLNRYSKPGWEHDPNEIWSFKLAAAEAIANRFERNSSHRHHQSTRNNNRLG
jgi:glycerol kinase